MPDRMFGRLSPPLERNRSITFDRGKGMKKSRNLQEIAGLFYKTVSKKAKKGCTNVGQDVIDHFIDVNKKVEVGSG